MHVTDQGNGILLLQRNLRKASFGKKRSELKLD